MAVPAYTNDLTDWIADSDTTAWGELTGAISGGAPDEADTESALQGTNTVSQSQNTTSVISMCRILGASVDLSATNTHAFVWGGHGVATALLSYANDGLGIAFATSLAAWGSLTVLGNDVPPMPYGKWVNVAVDPAYGTWDRSNGTPPSASAIYGIGSICQVSTKVAKGQPHVCDIIRYGRGEARFAAGELISDGDASDDPATFAGFAAANDASSARWGLIQATSGGYLWKGLMTLGYSGVVKMQDENVNLFVQDCRKTTSTFNKIEVNNASSIVYWTNVNITNLSPSTTVSDGDFEAVADADIQWTGCNFTDMGTFEFDGNSVIDGCTFLRCAQITTENADMQNSSVLESTAAVDTGAVYQDVAYTDTRLDGMTITKGTNAHHAIDFGTAITTDLTLRNIEFTGFGSTDDSNDSTVRFLATSGSLTLSLVGCTVDGVAATTGNFSVDDAVGSLTVTVSIDPVDITITVKDIEGNLISNAQTAVYATDDDSELMNEDTVAGVAVQSYGGATPRAVRVWVRKASSGATKYKNYSSEQSIAATVGLPLTITMVEDPNNNATT